MRVDCGTKAGAVNLCELSFMFWKLLYSLGIELLRAPVYLTMKFLRGLGGYCCYLSTGVNSGLRRARFANGSLLIPLEKFVGDKAR